MGCPYRLICLAMGTVICFLPAGALANGGGLDLATPLYTWAPGSSLLLPSGGSNHLGDFLPAGACHPNLCLKQPLTLNPHGICFSYYVELFTLCLFVPNWVSDVLDFVFCCETR